MKWRRLLSSLNFLTVLVLLGALFIMVNYLSSRHSARWDLSRQQLTALSDKTIQTLKSLKDPVSITVLLPSEHQLYGLVKSELNEYERHSPKITIAYVDPEQDLAKTQQLVKELDIKVTGSDSLNVIIFQSGPRHKVLSDAGLAEYEDASEARRGPPRVKTFKGEQAFTSAILSVAQETSPLVWVTNGHGEKSVEAPDQVGLSDLKGLLKQQNLTVKPVALLGQTSIPAEVQLVVIPGPTRRFTESELAVLQTYLERGGRCLALIDPLENTGLDGLLERWGIALGMDIVVDPANRIPFVSAANLLVTTYTHHPIVDKMKTLMTLFPLARSVSQVSHTPEGLTVTPLALTSEAGWGETSTSVETFRFDEGKDLKGPVSIAVASERRPAAPQISSLGATPAQPTPPHTRLVVIGDSDFVINAQLGNVGNRDFILAAVDWLIDQEQLIGIGPKALESVKLNLTSGQLTSVFWFSFLVMPLACTLLGLGMWLFRRH